MATALDLDLINRPLAIHPGRLEGVLASGAAAGQFGLDEEEGEEEEDVRGGIAVLRVSGPILSQGSWLSRALGWPDHASLGEAADRLRANSNVRAVVLALNSPGGDCQGCFEAADKFAALAAEKPLFAVADHNAYSAAYALAASAKQIFVSKAGGVGSVGVVAAHVDQSVRDHAMGLKVTIVRFGAKKADGNPHEPLSDGARSDLQAEVDALGEEFVAHVAKARGLKPEAVRAQEAGTYMGQAGVDAGLADQVGTFEDAMRAAREAIKDPSPFEASRAARQLANEQFRRSA